jgi:hypothetical protein
MSLSPRQQRLLDHIDAALSHADPRLAGQLAVFGRLTAGQPMPRREELRTPASRIRAAAAACGAAITALTIRAGATMARAGGATAWLPQAGPGPPQPPPQLVRAGPARNTPTGGQHMPGARHPSPLPPDPDTGTSGSPLPPNPHRTSSGSPLPPDPVTGTGGSPPQDEASPPPGPAGRQAASQPVTARAGT